MSCKNERFSLQGLQIYLIQKNPTTSAKYSIKTNMDTLMHASELLITENSLYVVQSFWI